MERLLDYGSTSDSCSGITVINSDEYETTSGEDNEKLGTSEGSSEGSSEEDSDGVISDVILEDLIGHSLEDIENERDELDRKIENLRKVNRLKAEAQEKRQKGLPYLGTQKGEDGKRHPVLKAGKVMGETCNNENCKKSKNFKCDFFTEQDRDDIFNKFYALNMPLRINKVKGLVDKTQPKKRAKMSPDKSSQKTYTYIYHLILNGTRVQVCKKMFLNTLALNDSTVRRWVLMKDSTDFPQKRNARKSTAERKIKYLELQDFLKSLPAVESHYRRKSSKRTYLEGPFHCKFCLYSVYSNKMKDEEKNTVSYGTFLKVMKRMKISIFKCRNDVCNKCFIALANGLTEDPEFLLHLKRKNEAQESKKFDKKYSSANVLLLCLDVQALLTCPRFNCNILYYLRKHILRNFTSYNLKNKKVKCFIWDESEGGVDSSIFATLYEMVIIQEIQESEVEITEIIIYSDGCGYQNRNKELANMLLYLSKKLKIKIEHKYLEPGHSQMEVDSCHSSIERKLKNAVIESPKDFIPYMEKARENPFPYEVIYLQHDVFKNYQNLTMYKTIRPAVPPSKKKKNDEYVAKVVDIRSLKYTPSGEIFFKLLHTDDYKILPQKAEEKSVEECEALIKKMYTQRLKISEDKYNDLKQLIPYMKSSVAKDFYLKLPH